MKNSFYRLLIIVLLSLINTKIDGQVVNLPTNPKTNLIEFTELVKVDSALTQEALYTRANGWFANKFKEYIVIQKSKKIAEEFFCNGSFSPKGLGAVNYTLKVHVMDGCYQYWVTNFVHVELTKGSSGGRLENDKPDCGYELMDEKIWKQTIPSIVLKNVDSLTKSLYNSLTKESKENR
jgi:hypothetical protein